MPYVLGITCALVIGALSGCARPTTSVGEDTELFGDLPYDDLDDVRPTRADATDGGREQAPAIDAAAEEEADAPDAEVSIDAAASRTDGGRARPTNPFEVLFGDGGLLGGFPRLPRP